MMPFVCDELKKIYKKLLKMIVETPAIEKAVGPTTLLKGPINKETLLPVLCFKLPTSTLATLKCTDELKKNLC